jgi:hypothetical protein
MQVCNTPVSKMDPQPSMMTVVSSVFLKADQGIRKKCSQKGTKSGVEKCSKVLWRDVGGK